MTAAATAKSAKQDAAQDQQSDCVQIIDRTATHEERRDNPIPQRHHDPSQHRDAHQNQQYFAEAS
jgi:hypothetical protein